MVFFHPPIFPCRLYKPAILLVGFHSVRQVTIITLPTSVTVILIFPRDALLGGGMVSHASPTLPCFAVKRQYLHRFSAKLHRYCVHCGAFYSVTVSRSAYEFQAIHFTAIFHFDNVRHDFSFPCIGGSFHPPSKASFPSPCVVGVRIFSKRCTMELVTQNFRDNVRHNRAQTIASHVHMIAVAVLAYDIHDFFRIGKFQTSDIFARRRHGFGQSAFYELLFLHDFSFLASVDYSTTQGDG